MLLVKIHSFSLYFRYIEIISVQKKPAISNEINPKFEGFKAEVYLNTAPEWPSLGYD